MSSKLTLIMALALMTFTITQCKKKTDEPAEETPAPATTGPNSVADIIAANGSPNNTFTVDAAVGRTLTINGVLLDIPASAFTDASSSVVSAGVVTVTVKTILTKPQVILSGAGANASSSRLVTTKGCVKATASQNTQSLRMNNSANMYVCVPDPMVTPAPQKKYYAPKVTATDSTKFWAFKSDSTDIPTTVYGSQNYHKARLDTLEWLNVGSFDNSAGTKVAVTVTVDPMFNETNTMIYLSYDGSLTVGALFKVAPGVFHIKNVPSGVQTTIIGIAAINGQYYAKAMPFTVSNTTVGLSMTAMSQTDMVNLVNTLP